MNQPEPSSSQMMESKKLKRLRKLSERSPVRSSSEVSFENSRVMKNLSMSLENMYIKDEFASVVNEHGHPQVATLAPSDPALQSREPPRIGISFSNNNSENSASSTDDDKSDMRNSIENKKVVRFEEEEKFFAEKPIKEGEKLLSAIKRGSGQPKEVTWSPNAGITNKVPDNKELTSPSGSKLSSNRINHNEISKNNTFGFGEVMRPRVIERGFSDASSIPKLESELPSTKPSNLLEDKSHIIQSINEVIEVYSADNNNNQNNNDYSSITALTISDEDRAIYKEVFGVDLPNYNDNKNDDILVLETKTLPLFSKLWLTLSDMIDYDVIDCMSNMNAKYNQHSSRLNIGTKMTPEMIPSSSDYDEGYIYDDSSTLVTPNPAKSLFILLERGLISAEISLGLKSILTLESFRRFSSLKNTVLSEINLAFVHANLTSSEWSVLGLLLIDAIIRKQKILKNSKNFKDWIGDYHEFEVRWDQLLVEHIEKLCPGKLSDREFPLLRTFFDV